jgi:hypothetical protein
MPLTYIKSLGDGTTIGNSPVRTNFLKDNLLAYYKLDEASGTRFDAHASNDLDTVASAPPNRTGIDGNGLDMGGLASGDRLSRGTLNEPALNGLANFSFSIWFNMDASQWATLFTNRWNGSDLNFEITIPTTPKVRFMIDSISNYAVSTTTLSTGTTYNLVGIYKGTNDTGKMRLFINGVEETVSETGTIPSATSVTGSNFSVGSRGPGNEFNGWIDEFALWDRSITTSEAISLYNDGTGLFYGDFA